MWHFELTSKDLASPALAQELATQLQSRTEPATEDHPGPSAEELDALQTLCAQAVDLAASHGLKGEGYVSLVRLATGATSVHVADHDERVAVGQPLDPARMAAKAAARATEAQAAARAAARKKVTQVVKAAVGAATKAPALISPPKPTPAAAPKPMAARPAPPVPPASRPARQP
jgi:hypothetical protein